MNIDALLLIAGTLILLWCSRKPLLHPGSHGFYRFFGWEMMLLILIRNYRPWGEDPFSPHQLVAWPLLLGSIGLAYAGFASLKAGGQADQTRDEAGLYAFEKTTQLVTSGIFRYIRHPMYAALILLTWGMFFQAPGPEVGLYALAATVFFVLTALADERECLAYFGEAYAAYMQRSRRFIPYLF